MCECDVCEGYACVSDMCEGCARVSDVVCQGRACVCVWRMSAHISMAGGGSW